MNSVLSNSDICLAISEIYRKQYKEIRIERVINRHRLTSQTILLYSPLIKENDVLTMF